MRVTVTPDPAMTIDAVRMLMRNLEVFGVSADTSGLPDRMTVTTDRQMMHETMRILSDADVTIDDAQADGYRSFREVFGDKLPLDDERVTVYVTMCQEGRI